MIETGLAKAIKNQLPEWIYTHSNTGSSRFTTGIPDRFYDFDFERYTQRFDGRPHVFKDEFVSHALWAELKMLAAMPRDGIVGRVSNKTKGCYRTRQYEWMERRWLNSHNLPHGADVIGIIGLPNRTAVIQTTPTEWREGSSITNAMPFKEVAAWIRDFCSPSSGPSVRR